jgi:hypothetical protein
MAVAKRKTSGSAADSPSKKVKASKDSPKSSTTRKVLFGKVLEGEDNQDEDDDEDSGELEAEPIRDDDEGNSMEVDTPNHHLSQNNKIGMYFHCSQCSL